MCNIGLSLQGIDSEKQKEILRPMGWVAASIYATVTFATWSSRSLSAADGVTAVVSPDYSVVSCGGRLGSGGFTVQGQCLFLENLEMSCNILRCLEIS